MSEFEGAETQPRLPRSDAEKDLSWNLPLHQGSAFSLGRNPRTLGVGPPCRDLSEEDGLKRTPVLPRDRFCRFHKVGRIPGLPQTSNYGICPDGACQVPVGGYRYFGCSIGPFHVGHEYFGCSVR